MNIPASDARPMYTGRIVRTLDEKVDVPSFLRSFFPTIMSPTRQVSIEVRRNGRKVAVDVLRGQEGQRYEKSRSTLRQIIPPYYRQWFDATELDLYDAAMGYMSGEVSAGIGAEYIKSVADKLMELIKTIQRREELQCAQVLQTGVVLLDNDTDINFNRQAGSMVDLTSGGYWTGASVDPFVSINTACEWVRQYGKVAGNVFNLILGTSAHSALINNTVVKSRADIRNFNRDVILAPQKNAIGGTFQGQISAGSNLVNLWTYPELYEDPADGVTKPYILPENGIILPETTDFNMIYSAVPQVGPNGAPVQTGPYVLGEKIDEYDAVHKYDVKAACIAVPVAIDQIYTLKAVASS